ncbi:MAG TPA: AAA family ATPase [Xenococcaceae cyanobacterium]
MDLFEQSYQQKVKSEAPLAARMRPRTLEEFIGQDHIVGAGRLLRRAIVADQLSSLIFFGPPGTGKTTLARIIAQTTRAHFIAINAVLAGVKDIREAIATATDKGKYYQQKTILFVDEVHRFNKSQQDALLPWVENGTIILIGATTENPYFEVNKALVSRSRLFQLKPLTVEDLGRVVTQTLADSDRGYGKLKIQIEPEAIAHLTNVANGDARSLLNALELAVETTPPNDAGVIQIDLAVAEESIQQRAVLYDKEGDAHFDTISAFIKSVRGSDPDAALYWLAKMVYAGEDPRFILRRLLILASEDVGLADPNAVAVVNACAQAFDRVGMPEGRYPLAQAALYLATAPKSNSIMGFFDDLAAVEQEQQSDIPNHLKDANRDKKGLGHGAHYLYPHAYRDHWVEQQYLPSSLQGRVFYQPSDIGKEADIKTQVARRREAEALREQAATLPELLRPVVLNAQLNKLSSVLAKEAKDIRFDCIVGRNVLMSETDKLGIVENIILWLSADGVLVLAETVPRHTQRLYDLLQPAWMPSELWKKLKLAESAIYEDNSDPMVNWDGLDLKNDLEKVGLTVQVEQERAHTSILIAPALVERWFAPTQTASRQTYRQHLERMLTGDEVNLVQQVFSKYLCNQTVNWSSTVAYLLISSSSKSK